MCTISISENVTLNNGIISDFTVSGTVSGPGWDKCDRVKIELSDQSGLFAQAFALVGPTGVYSTTLITNRSVPCDTSVTIIVSCMDNEDCRAEETYFVPCQRCPTISISDIQNICDPQGNRLFTVFVNFSEPCSFEIATTGGSILYSGSVASAGPTSVSFTVPTVPSFVMVNLNIISPTGCPGFPFSLTVAGCPVPCPEVQFGAVSFGACNADGERTVSINIEIVGTGTFSATVHADGSSASLGTITNTSPNFTFSTVWPAGSTHTLNVNLLDAMCGDSSQVIDVPACAETCPTINFTPSFGGCDKDGNRFVSISVSASGSSNYIGTVLFDGQLSSGNLTHNTGHTINRWLPGGSSHSITVEATYPEYCGQSIYTFEAPDCATDPVDEVPPVDPPEMKCVLCESCAKWLQKSGATIWTFIACKLALFLAIAALAALITALAFVGAIVPPNPSGTIFAYLLDLSATGGPLIPLALTSLAFLGVLYKYCGWCCFYCALIFGAILGIIGIIMVVIASLISGIPLNWVIVVGAILVAFFFLSFAELLIKPQCDASVG